MVPIPTPASILSPQDPQQNESLFPSSSSQSSGCSAVNRLGSLVHLWTSHCGMGWNMLADPAWVTCPPLELRVVWVQPCRRPDPRGKLGSPQAESVRVNARQAGAADGNQEQPPTLAPLGRNLLDPTRSPSCSLGLMGRDKRSKKAVSAQCLRELNSFLREVR